MNRFFKGKWIGKETRMEERFIPRSDGSMLRICICHTKREQQSDAAGLLWLHGGGYAIGLPELDFSFIDRFAGDGSCVIVAPDYRRSTEAPYPAALEDGYQALMWMKDHSEELGIRKDQLFVGGNSAGGGLTAAICLYARDRNEVSIAFQMPLYPMLDDRMDTESAKDNDAPVWNTKSSQAAWKLYLNSQNNPSNIPVYAAPVRTTDYSHLPPTCTFVGSIEPFRDETFTYLERLREAGIPVHFKEFEGCFHAFDVVCPGTEASKDAAAFQKEFFQFARQHYFAAQPDL